MAVDLDRLVLDPVYAEFGRPALFTAAEGGAARPITVIDRTAGQVVAAGELAGAFTLQPAVRCRSSEMAAGSAGGGSIEIDGRTWRVLREMPVVGAAGGATGELDLLLEEVV